jgi:hypothetical protein
MEALALVDSHIGKRSETRTTLTVMVSMVAASASGPVCVCNLSTGGAMIEGHVLPAVGEQVELRRGDSVGFGEVVWRIGNRAGLKFEPRITVSDWQPTSHIGQQTVDKVFQDIRSGIGKAPLSPVRTASALPVEAEELSEAAGRLEELADALAGDEEVIARHAMQLQVLDLATQLLRKLAAAG